LTGIAAIVTGHMALGRIKKSGGVLQGRGIALAGLIIGYFFTVVFVIVIGVLASFGFVAGSTAFNKAKHVSAMASAMAVESAVQNFHMDYGTLPAEGSTDMTVDTAGDVKLLEVLLGMNSTVNPRSIQFLSVREGKDNKDGIVYTPDGQGVAGLFDPWGRGYQVRMDLDYDGKIDVGGITLENRQVVVWSIGPDGEADTADDVRTW
jgi:type II secretory pathway pseudopilin PulG